jgi:methylglutaconyl-CoA hydratase
MLIVESDERGVVTVTMNRPDVHNAFDGAMVVELNETLGHLAGNPEVHIVVLTGAGESFSAGADVNWMKHIAAYSKEQNIVDAGNMADMLNALDTLPVPTVARINGGAFGGAIGLIGACDIAIAASDALFGITEVRLGLIPSVISPYVLRSIGPRNARRFALTGEFFDAEEARRIGLVHEVVKKKSLDDTVETFVEGLLAGGPGAHEQIKTLFRDIWELDRTGSAARDDTARRIADRRATEEAKEGMTAFLAKRKPRWAKK